MEHFMKSDEEEMKKDPDVRMIPDGSSESSSDSAIDIISSDNIGQYQTGSVDSVTDVGKSRQELTTPNENERYEKDFNTFVFIYFHLNKISSRNIVRSGCEYL